MSKPKIYLLQFLLLTLGIAASSCSKEGAFAEGDHALIKQITADGVVDTKFEYKSGKLVQFAHFGFCPDPTTEERYSYKDGLLHEVRISTGAASSTMCPGTGGMVFTHTFVYDDLKRPVRINTTNDADLASYRILTYDGTQNLVSKVVSYAAGTDQAYGSIEFRYDARGNIIETIEATGVTHYKYDNKSNPFYLINRSPWFISVFNNSPNNVVEASGAVNFKTQILEYNGVFPVRVLESNGIEYKYHY